MLYFFNREGVSSVKNISLSETSLYKHPDDYAKVRDWLKSKGYIEVKDGREVSITKEGIEKANELLGVTDPDSFLRKLRILTLSPFRLSSTANENSKPVPEPVRRPWFKPLEIDSKTLFTFFMLAYSDSLRQEIVQDLLRNIADDYRQGLEEKLRQRISRAIQLLSINGFHREELYLRLFDGYVLMHRLAYLVYLWSFYRFSNLAFHIVVRFAALAVSGRMSQFLIFVNGAIYTLVLQSFLQIFRISYFVDILVVLLQVSLTLLSIMFFMLAVPVLAVLLSPLYRFLRRSIHRILKSSAPMFLSGLRSQA